METPSSQQTLEISLAFDSGYSGSKNLYVGFLQDPNEDGSIFVTEERGRPNVGAPDPELKNSPIFDDADNDDLSLDLELETGVCYFNSTAYPVGQYVCSGNELLRCENRGVWIREGSCYEDY